MKISPQKIFSVTHKFNLDQSSNYHLAINLGQGFLKVCCIERFAQTCLLLNIYALPPNKSHPSYIKSLEQLYNEDFFLLKKEWYTVTLSISNQRFTLLPHLLLSKQDLAIYMHVACGVDPNEEVTAFTHALAKVSVVFSENATLLEWFRRRYSNSNFQIIHQVNAIIEGLSREGVSKKTELFVWLEKQYLYIVVHRKKQLHYCNSFTYETSKDFLHALSAVIQVMQLEPNHCYLIIGGLIEKRSLAYSQLKAYIPKTILKTKIHFLNADTPIFKKNDTPPMLYFDLMSSFLCHPDHYAAYPKH